MAKPKSQQVSPPLDKKKREFLDLAMKRLAKCVLHDEEDRAAGIEDLQFINGDQWPTEELKRRKDKGRPALKINLLPKYIDQVTGDMLQNTPTIKVRPVDSKGDVNIAKIRQGLISNIEYLSNAKAIYGYAAKQMVSSGFGAWRVLTRYTEENPFLQEAYLESIRNPFAVFLDPSAKDQNYADAKYGFIIRKMPVEDYATEYPNSPFPKGSLDLGTGLSEELWYDSDTITIAEYFSVEKEPVTMVQLTDGRVMTKEEYEKVKEKWAADNSLLINQAAVIHNMPGQPSSGQPQPGMPMMQGPSSGQPQPGMPMMQGPQSGQPHPGMGTGTPAAPMHGMHLANRIQSLGEEPVIANERVTDRGVVRHWIITAMDILSGGDEGKKVPGKYIPLVLVKGKELNIEGRNHVYSLIRHAKDSVRLNNYWHTVAAETIALAPKAPWLGTAKQFEGYEDDYAAANVENFPYLKYNADPEAPGPPQRVPPAQPPMAIFEQIRRGEENLKSVLGMFNADVGAPDSRQTGAAVIAGQKPGDISTSEFSENMARAVMHTGRILNEMIPDIYDTERDIRIRNLDESETFLPVNTTVGSALQSLQTNPETYSGLDVNKIKGLMHKEGSGAKFNDITAGKYDIVVTVGPSYATQRQESAQHLLQLVQAMPQQLALAADLIIQNLDFKDADELAARIRKTLPPGIVKPRPGEPPPPPPQPSPEAMAAQVALQVEQAKVQLAQLKVQQEQVKGEHEKTRIQIEQIKAQMEIAKAQMEMRKLEMEISGERRPVPEYDPVEMAEKDRQFALDIERMRQEQNRLENQLAIERAKLGVKAQLDTAKLGHERKKAEETHKAQMAKARADKRKAKPPKEAK